MLDYLQLHHSLIIFLNQALSILKKVVYNAKEI